jgi:hypothetical protein
MERSLTIPGPSPPLRCSLPARPCRILRAAQRARAEFSPHFSGHCKPENQPAGQGLRHSTVHVLRRGRTPVREPLPPGHRVLGGRARSRSRGRPSSSHAAGRRHMDGAREYKGAGRSAASGEATARLSWPKACAASPSTASDRVGRAGRNPARSRQIAGLGPHSRRPAYEVMSGFPGRGSADRYRRYSFASGRWSRTQQRQYGAFRQVWPAVSRPLKSCGRGDRLQSAAFPNSLFLRGIVVSAASRWIACLAGIIGAATLAAGTATAAALTSATLISAACATTFPFCHLTLLRDCLDPFQS